MIKRHLQHKKRRGYCRNWVKTIKENYFGKSKHKQKIRQIQTNSDLVIFPLFYMLQYSSYSVLRILKNDKDLSLEDTYVIWPLGFFMYIVGLSKLNLMDKMFTIYNMVVMV